MAATEPDDAPAVPPRAANATVSSADTAAGRPAPAAPEAVHIPGYEVLRVLGRGGMGVVYQARQVGLNRTVALKMILAGEHASAADLGRFRTEAEAVARQQHPNIVAIHGIGEHHGLPYFSLEYCDGGSLEERLDGTPWPAPAAAAFVETVASAIHHAHEHGVVHRDLKPANILLVRTENPGPRSGGPEGPTGFIPKITDFGLAKRLDSGTAVTQSGAILGTPSYMAPEQAGGDRHVGPAADVYALGAVLYELLTGRPPFKAATPFDTLLQVIGDDPVAPSKLQSKTPRDLETICLKCLAKAPGQRYATAADLAGDLRRFQGGEPVRARPVSPLVRALKWVRRRPAVATLAGAAVALLALGIGSVIAHQRQQLLQQRAREAAERQARATALVDSLPVADTAGLPQIIRGIEPVRAEADRLLRARYAGAAPASQGRFRYALALLPADPDVAEELIAFLPAARADEVLVLRDALRGQAAQVAALWPRLATATPGVQLRLAALLAAYVPADERWQPHAARLVHHLVRLNPLELAAWSPALAPLSRSLTPTLLETYRAAQAQLKGGGLNLEEVVATAAQFDLAANLLAPALAGQPDLLAELLQTCDARHYLAFLEAARAHRSQVVAHMHAVGGRKPAAATDGELDALAVRQAHAAATLLHFDEPDPGWAMLRHTPDPTARSYLIHALGPRGVDPVKLIDRYAVEPEVSARRALVLALGEFDPAKVPAAAREQLAARLLGEYRDHPDPGLHAAIDWLLRQKWGRAADLNRVVAERQGRPAEGRDWFVNGVGQTFTILRGPVEFTIGSPPEEPGRYEVPPETQSRQTIPRTFAIAAREVTVADCLRFQKTFRYSTEWARDQDAPVNAVSWYEAIAYCRWLSEQDGVPEPQMCYPPLDQIKPGMRLDPEFLRRSGYRLPTDAEWEYACRAGALTARPYGHGTDLLGRYGWFLRTARTRLWPCGRLKPNDFGLFDMLGNVDELCQDLILPDGRTDSVGEEARTVGNDQIRLSRGASVSDIERPMRSAARRQKRPGDKVVVVGFRPVRTMP